MKIGEIIGCIAEQKGINLRQLALKADIPYNTLYAIVKRNSARIEVDKLQRLAQALDVSVSDLLGQVDSGEPHGPWGLGLERKLAAVGCSIGFYEEDAYIWINYPDGTLEVTDAELQELDESTDSFLRFKLQELREKRPNDFKPKQRRREAAESTPAPTEGQSTTLPAAPPETPPEGK